MVCAKCNKEFEGGYSVEGLDICDECGRKYTLAELESLKKKNEDATQASMVDGGRISVFGSKSDNDLSDFYKELFELKDYNEAYHNGNDTLSVDYRMRCMTLSNKPGEGGKLKNGTYFLIDKDELLISPIAFIIDYNDEDGRSYARALDSEKIIKYDKNSNEYKIIADQTINDPFDDGFGLDDKYTEDDEELVRCPICSELTKKSVIDSLGMCWDCNDNGIV